MFQNDRQRIYYTKPSLKYGFEFSDLFKPEKLKELATIFDNYYKTHSPNSFIKFLQYRDNRDKFTEIEKSEILIDVSRNLDVFLSDFFNINNEIAELKNRNERTKVIFSVKKEFIQRRAFKKYSGKESGNINFKDLNNDVNELKKILYSHFNWVDEEELSTALMINDILEIERKYRIFLDLLLQDSKPDEELKNRALNILTLMEDSQILKKYVSVTEFGKYKNPSAENTDVTIYESIKNLINLLLLWSYARYYDDEEKKKIKNWVLYKFPTDINYDDLVINKTTSTENPELIEGDKNYYRRRDGFELTDNRYDELEVSNEIEYCVFCHKRNKDSCNKGLKDKENEFKKNPLGIKLQGCPLDEKISEMHFLKNEGFTIGALALVILDNPMCPGTGHRICNDCMKACIYQKQEPVNIPQIETRVLTDVLEMPWGFEIYSLLTRWNPVNTERPYELPYNGKKILVVGLGPAGYTLSHYLLNEGFCVVGIDGLKIEPILKELTGYTDENGLYHEPLPLKNFFDIEQKLDERIFLGFGGVSEYGITVRWDKNFLTIIYLAIVRRKHFKFYDGVRFGGTIEIEDAWKLGFDHIAIATGAGKPTIAKIKNNLIRGFRMASDFLMSLQLTGAAKKNSITNLQLQLPVVVIGGGLTAIDTATESMAYYPVQVEKFLERYEKLILLYGEGKFWEMFDEEEKNIAEKFIEHGKQIRAERQRAESAEEKPDFIPLLRKWGGVTIAYRKNMNDSPAYRLNHEEIIKSLEEGIYFLEKLNPIEAIADKYGAVQEIIFQKQEKTENGKWIGLEEYIPLPAKTVLIAAGTSPNVIYEREHPGTFQLDERNQFFQTYKLTNDGKPHLQKTEKGETGFFTSYDKDGKFITVYGDNHPVYAGNVVKAMASARDGYKEILKLFDKVSQEVADEEECDEFLKKLNSKLKASVISVNILTPNIIELIVKAPLQAEKFKPGQFYRLQNYEIDADCFENTSLMMEGLALTGAWVDADTGLLSLIVLEMGGSSRLCRYLKTGQRVVVMGPTGSPTEIPKNENVLLAGGGLGNAVLFSIAKAMKLNGNKVIYFAGYKNSTDLFKQCEVEEFTDQVIWSNDNGEPIKPRREQDRTFKGNIVQSMLAYAKAELENNNEKPEFDFKTIDRIIAIGSDRMMNAVKEARHGILNEYLKPKHNAIGSINSTMQCMMKEVCAQCLQRHIDPETGKEYFVFSCFNQDQKLDAVDFNNLNSRLKNNSVLEKQTKLWLDYILEEKILNL